MTTHYLTDLMEPSDATAHGFKMLEPNGKPIPNRVCRICANYRAGGICDKAKHGVTSALEPADDKECFTPISGSPKVMVPEVNDTPVRERRAKTIARYQSKAAKEKREAEKKNAAGQRTKKVVRPADAAKPGPKIKPVLDHKVCVTCGRDLPLDSFPKSKQKDKKDGHCDQCTECRTARYASRSPYKTEEERKEARRRTNNACWHRKSDRMKAEREASEADGMRVCKCCGKSKPLEEFTRTRGGARMHTCKECMVEKWKRGGRNRWKGKAPMQVTLHPFPIPEETVKELVMLPKQAPQISSVDVVPVEQVQRTIDKARDKALALGLEKVAQCLAEAAQAMEGIAKELKQ